MNTRKDEEHGMKRHLTWILLLLVLLVGALPGAAAAGTEKMTVTF